MGAMRIEALLAGGYALFLAGAATALELMARHAHRRSMAVPTKGFLYHSGLDVWICPTGQHLHRTHSNQAVGVFRYRADARICNECAVKRHCTDSEEGRVIEQYADSWLQSGLRQFHRGLSLALLVLAFLGLSVELFRQQGLAEQIAIGSLAVLIGARGVHSLAGLRAATRK
jgi:hypothetical protein